MKQEESNVNRRDGTLSVRAGRATPTVLEAFLYGLPIAVSLALIYWVLRLLASQARWERLVLTGRDMGRAKRTFGVLLLMFMCFNLYLPLVMALVSLTVFKTSPELKFILYQLV